MLAADPEGEATFLSSQEAQSILTDDVADGCLLNTVFVPLPRMVIAAKRTLGFSLPVAPSYLDKGSNTVIFFESSSERWCCIVGTVHGEFHLVEMLREPESSILQPAHQ